MYNQSQSEPTAPCENRYFVVHVLHVKRTVKSVSGGFFLACKEFRRMFDDFIPGLSVFFLFVVVLFVFNLGEISSRTLIPLFTPGSVHSGSAS